MIVIAEELRANGIHHGSRSIVETSWQGAEIRNRHIIARLIVHRSITNTRLPFRIFQAFYTLKIHNIRISKLHAKRTHAMKIEQKMMLCSTFSHLIY